MKYQLNIIGGRGKRKLKLRKDKIMGRKTKYSYYPPWSRSIKNRILQRLSFIAILSKNETWLILKTLIPYMLVLISILVSHLLFSTDDMLIFLSYIILIPIFVILKFDGRIPIGYAILLLIIAAVILTFGNEDLANQVAIYTYWLLVVGVICLTIEYIREGRRDERKPDT